MDNKTRWMNRPNNIQEDDFSQLLCLWSNKDVEKRCLQAKESRMSQTNMHTAGPKSFARIREEMGGSRKTWFLMFYPCFVRAYDDTDACMEEEVLKKNNHSFFKNSQLMKQAIFPRVHGLALKTTVAAVFHLSRDKDDMVHFCQ
ncbi:hypothetical protein L1987_15061 [Smallanthus sonchifolius]|uniref:Uncharacterized protein n=1 Tax=Smallanthus sonchifolius TaxID=185202 RepID=A0ACB9J6J8_9ASTR|nr:hypothetical protein L1987_15061 [Smallanthus sonchifolius]